MPAKGLKPAIPRPSARAALAAADTLSRQVGLPPAAMAPVPAAAPRPAPLPAPGAGTPVAEALVQVNIRVRRSLGDQLADQARAAGTTQKVLICRALAAAGFTVHPEDLAAPPPPRRRGSSS